MCNRIFGIRHMNDMHKISCFSMGLTMHLLLVHSDLDPRTKNWSLVIPSRCKKAIFGYPLVILNTQNLIQNLTVQRPLFTLDMWSAIEFRYPAKWAALKRILVWVIKFHSFHVLGHRGDFVPLSCWWTELLWYCHIERELSWGFFFKYGKKSKTDLYTASNSRWLICRAVFFPGQVPW